MEEVVVKERLRAQHEVERESKNIIVIIPKCVSGLRWRFVLDVDR